MSDRQACTSRSRRLCLSALGVLTAGLVSAACEQQPSCSGGLQPYKGNCLSNTAIEYVGCTEGRGISPTTEIGGGVAGTLKVVADASLELAYEKSEAENTPVALQIVRDCLEIAKETAKDTSEVAAVETYQQQVETSLDAWRDEQIAGTPEITLSVDHASTGETVTVTGDKFWADETVEIYVHATLVTQVKADGSGHFQADIVVPPGSPPPDFITTIRATGRSSVKTAQAPFHT